MRAAHPSTSTVETVLVRQPGRSTSELFECGLHRVMTRAFLFALAMLGSVVPACKTSPPSPELLVFAAASTADSLDEIGQKFQKKSAVVVRFSFAASRDLARQVRAGAPADVLVSADAETIDALVSDNLVLPEDRRRIVSNRLVVIVPLQASLDLQHPGDLRRASRIALGDPAVVPAGSYAKKWLQTAGLWAELERHVVPTLDVRAALAAVESGRADAGIVYRTDAATSSRVRVIYEVTPDKSLEIEYVAARLARSKLLAAPLFLAFLTGQEARATFARHGFVLYP
jgi:molybdate transport system substrate-binding protein